MTKCVKNNCVNYLIAREGCSHGYSEMKKCVANYYNRYEKAASKQTDNVSHPSHYTGHPSGIECIQVTEHLSFCRGNAIKYLWRAGQKDRAKEIEDMKKAIWYIEREISLLERQKNG